LQYFNRFCVEKGDAYLAQDILGLPVQRSGRQHEGEPRRRGFPACSGRGNLAREGVQAQGGDGDAFAPGVQEKHAARRQENPEIPRSLAKVVKRHGLVVDEPRERAPLHRGGQESIPVVATARLRVHRYAFEHAYDGLELPAP
jgi:hypothetical protein